MICFSCMFSLYFDLFVLIFMLLFYDLLLMIEPDLLATTFIRPGSLKEAGAALQFFLEQETWAAVETVGSLLVLSLVQSWLCLEGF